jgi:hypothetical protein
MIVEIQVLPIPVGPVTHRWTHVDAATGIIACSGLLHPMHDLSALHRTQRDR